MSKIRIESNDIKYNCRRYDNHILYGRLMGYNNAQLFKLSQDIINGKNSYVDVYDFSTKKQSLKKFEIELGLPWDQPVPEEL